MPSHTIRNGAAVGAASSEHVSQGKSNTPPHLWPDRAKRQGTRAILYGVFRYLRRKGHYPIKGELSRFLKAKMYAVVWYADECFKEGVLEKPPSFDRELRITDKGWAVLGCQPIMPTTRRKERSVRWRAKVAANIIKEVLRETGGLQG